MDSLHIKLMIHIPVRINICTQLSILDVIKLLLFRLWQDVIIPICVAMF